MRTMKAPARRICTWSLKSARGRVCINLQQYMFWEFILFGDNLLFGIALSRLRFSGIYHSRL